jgi:hypothetical protein
MNAHVATGIRELTAQELDQVTGGRGAEMDAAEVFAFTFTVGSLAMAALSCLFDWLFN